jgi:hypothetical protein
VKASAAATAAATDAGAPPTQPEASSLQARTRSASKVGEDGRPAAPAGVRGWRIEPRKVRVLLLTLQRRASAPRFTAARRHAPERTEMDGQVAYDVLGGLAKLQMSVLIWRPGEKPPLPRTAAYRASIRR